MVIVEAGRRGPGGQYTSAEATLLRSDGSELTFRLRAKDIREPELLALTQRIDEAGAIPSPIKSLSIRNLTAEVDMQEREARSQRYRKARKARAQRKRRAARKRRPNG